MGSAQDLIVGALRLCTVVAAGELPSPEELQDGLIDLNEMIASWNSSRRYIYNANYTLWSLTANLGAYSIGPLGVFQGLRPNSIRSAQFVNANREEQVIEIISSEKWAMISDKLASSRIVTKLYYDNAYPTAMVNLWPVPSQAGCNLGLYTWVQLNGFVNLTDILDFPPGYEMAMKYSLAEIFIVEFSRQPNPELSRQAVEFRANIQQLNLPPGPGTAEEGNAQAAAQQLAQPPAGS